MKKTILALTLCFTCGLAYATTISETASNKVSIAGDTMTGNLNISSSCYISGNLKVGGAFTAVVSSVATNAVGTTQLQENAVNRNEGIITTPTITDAAGVAVDITSCKVLLRSTTYFGDSKLYEMTVAPTLSLAMSANTVNYIYANYSGGTPVYSVTTNINDINDSNKVHVANVYMDSQNIDYLFAFAGEGLAEAQRNHNRVLRLRNIERESGFSVACATKVATVALGIAWHGTKEINLGAMAMGKTTSEIWYHSAGNWTSISTGTINADKYDNLTSTVSVGAGKYSVNWIYRSIAKTDIDIVMGQGNYSLLQAGSALPPIPPEALKAFYILVGKIIIKKGDTTPTGVENVSTTYFQTASVINHNDLSNIDGGVSGQYYHNTLSTMTALLYGNETNLHKHNAANIGAGIMPATVVASSVAVNAVTTNTILNNAVTSAKLADSFTATAATITAISCTNIWGDGSHLTNLPPASSGTDTLAREETIRLGHFGDAFVTAYMDRSVSPQYGFLVDSFTVSVDSNPKGSDLIYAVLMAVQTSSATYGNYQTIIGTCSINSGDKRGVWTVFTSTFTSSYANTIPAGSKFRLDCLSVGSATAGGNHSIIAIHGRKQ